MHQKEPTRHPLVRPISRMAIVCGVIASTAFAVFAKDDAGPMPQISRPFCYGSGWLCDLGCRVASTKCLALNIPEHAHPMRLQ